MEGESEMEGESMRGREHERERVAINTIKEKILKSKLEMK